MLYFVYLLYEHYNMNILLVAEQHSLDHFWQCYWYLSIKCFYKINVIFVDVIKF